MTPTPTPAALEAARKCLEFLPSAHGQLMPEPCGACDRDREEHVAAAMEGYARSVVALWLEHENARNDLDLMAMREPRKTVLPQEDASNAP